jgi:hypothetical protein
VVGAPSHLGCCDSPTAKKGENLRERSDPVSELASMFWSIWGGGCVRSGR